MVTALVIVIRQRVWDGLINLAMNELPTSGSPARVTGWAMESSDQKLTVDEKLLHGTLTYLRCNSSEEWRQMEK